MYFDLITILVILVLITGLITLVDKVFWRKSRLRQAGEMPFIIEQARSLFPVLVAVLLIRSCGMQIMHIPSGSLEPTVMPGDFVFVTQYNYGIRLPMLNTIIIPTSQPKRGDIVVFKWPVDPQTNLIKRVIGLPGDKISLINNVLYINGQIAPQRLIGQATDNDGDVNASWPVNVLVENLDGIQHRIYQCELQTPCPSHTPDFYNFVVPAGSYFMMGDNRDNSDDSRSWGVVPMRLIEGKAQIILFNFSWQHGFNMSRVGLGLTN